MGPLSNSTDLSYVFKQEPRVTFSDSYSHLNELGQGILSDAVVSRLKAAGIVRSSSAPSGNYR